MTFYKTVLLIIFQSSLLMAEDSLDFKEYQIELIIFQHSNTNTDEVFQNEFKPPQGRVLNFYNPNLQLNKKSFNVKTQENFFTNLFKNIGPMNTRDRKINKDKTNIKVANPKSWYRKDNNLQILAKLNDQLSRNTNYRLLDSFSWIQNIENEDNSSYLYHEDFGKKYGFFLKFYKSRFLHTDLKAYMGLLNLSETDTTESYIDKYDKKLLEVSSTKNLKNNIEIKLNNKNDFVDINSNKKTDKNEILTTEKIKWFIDEDKRIFNKEIHYFDHPYFGIVISVNEI
ncbi:peptidoglycan binding protein CsiV [Gammaproteobacteria bacterium]|nr:peptidoglycan binding protein CsiV [Gammaproteobacteria bacterium]